MQQCKLIISPNFYCILSCLNLFSCQICFFVCIYIYYSSCIYVFFFIYRYITTVLYSSLFSENKYHTLADRADCPDHNVKETISIFYCNLKDKDHIY